MRVVIAGGGIAGLVMGLSLHQIGVPFRIFERVRTPRPLGVGINLQPTAVRELFSLGLEDVLDGIGVATQDYGFYTRTGVEIWTEPRGRHAGYHWPQYSVHRGQLQMALLETLIDRCGPDCVTFDAEVLAYRTTETGVELDTMQNGARRQHAGAMLVGADGIHSALRAQMYPEEGAPVWGGAIMWRGTSLAAPFLSEASMILAGHDTQRFVAYPISPADPRTGLATINWIAERKVDPSQHTGAVDWNRQVSADRFAAEFAAWDFGWIDVPALIAKATAIFEYPMVDRAPVSSWSDGATTLIGDAAHATYPVGSSGASQAIVDARILTAEIRRTGPSADACLAYELQVRDRANAVTLANRGSGGPDAIMQMAEDRTGGDFARLDNVLPMAERQAHADSFKRLAGLSVEGTNEEGPILPV